MNDSNRDSFDDWWADPTQMPYAILPHTEEKDKKVPHHNLPTPIQGTQENMSLDMSVTPAISGSIVQRIRNTHRIISPRVVRRLQFTDTPAQIIPTVLTPDIPDTPRSYQFNPRRTLKFESDEEENETVERSQFRTPDTCNPSGSLYESLQKQQQQRPTFTPRSPARRFHRRNTPRTPTSSNPVSSGSTTPSTSSRTNSQKTKPLRIRF